MIAWCCCRSPTWWYGGCWRACHDRSTEVCKDVGLVVLRHEPPPNSDIQFRRHDSPMRRPLASAATGFSPSGANSTARWRRPTPTSMAARRSRPARKTCDDNIPVAVAWRVLNVSTSGYDQRLASLAPRIAEQVINGNDPSNQRRARWRSTSAAPPAPCAWLQTTPPARSSW